MNNRIIKLEDLKKPQDLGRVRILTGGCFDIVHYGHVIFLQKAKEIGGSLIVALESDRHIKEYKKRNPFHNQQQRAQIISAFRFVDCVILLPYLQGFEQYYNMVSVVKPHYIAVEKSDRQISNKEKQAKKIKAKLMVVTDHINNTSTSKLIDAVKSSNQ